VTDRKIPGSPMMPTDEQIASVLPVKWGDSQQYHAETHEHLATDLTHGGVQPKVTLLSMTPQPLAAVAAMAFMYEGRVVRDLSELSRREIEEKWADVLATHLDTPLEAVQLHFLIEGVDRAFTHQLVRQRVGVAYAQESLRFAVVDDLTQATTLPPSLAGTVPAGSISSKHPDYEEAMAEERQRWRYTWDQAIGAVDDAYRALVDAGMPAEEARGLLPHATATRVVYVTNLRALKDHAGNRLCTQAQFHWRQVFAQIIQAIRNHGLYNVKVPPADEWQYETIADSKLFRPVCYQQGRCPFKASFDRACSIRERVDAFASLGVPSETWGETYDPESGYADGPPRTGQVGGPPYIRGIQTAEWLVNPGAARA
jgi:flavin-dependent thymidylate synthase